MVLGCLSVLILTCFVPPEHLSYRDILPSILWVLVPLPSLLADEDEFCIMFHVFGILLFVFVIVAFSCKKDPRGDWYTIVSCLAKTYWCVPLAAIYSLEHDFYKGCDRHKQDEDDLARLERQTEHLSNLRSHNGKMSRRFYCAMFCLLVLPIVPTFFIFTLRFLVDVVATVVSQ